MTRLGDTATRVLGAVLDLHARNGRVTLRAAAKAVGRSPGTVHQSLLDLRAAGLVTWEDGTAATLRPTCTATRVCSASLGGDNLGGPGAASTAPAPAGPARRPDMAGQYLRAAARDQGGSS